MSASAILRGAGRAIRTTWLLVGVTLILLLLLEFASGFLLDWTEPAHQAIPDWVAAYGSQDWMREYETEFRGVSKTAWEPYVYWRTRPFEGKHIRVDQAGRRHTWKDPATPADAPVIWVFGGSTAWGICARDDYTIPSSLARALSEREHAPANVVNLGEFGFVSGQEVVLLTRMLEAGERAAFVVFYDGVNDMFSAYQNKEAGIPQNEANRRTEFEAAKRGLGKALAESAVKSRTNRLLQRLLRRTPSEAGETKLQPEEETKLAAGVAASYFANVRLVEALGREYKFTPLFFWQPSVFDKEPLSAFEQQCRERHAYLASFFVASRNQIREQKAGGGDRFFDLSGMFANEASSIFTDFCHVTEDGNRRIAEAIAREIVKAL